LAKVPPDLKIPDIQKIRSKPLYFLGTLTDYRRYLVTLITFAKANGADFTGVPKPDQEQLEEWFAKLENALLESFCSTPATCQVHTVLRIYCSKKHKKALQKLPSWVSASTYAEKHGLEAEFIELTETQLAEVQQIKSNPNVYYEIQPKQVPDPLILGRKMLQLAKMISELGPTI
jgi:hypothetical protein